MSHFKEKQTKERNPLDHKKKSGGFQSMGFSWQVLKSIINSGYKQPTPIQRKAIPEILLGKDVVAMARTGSGKTAAFLLPMFHRLQENSSKNSFNRAKNQPTGPRALVMSPTRELALQTFKFTKQFGKYVDFKVAVILGGDKIEEQFETMHENPDIIIATPGRFLHICVEMNLKLGSIEYMVFDEADRLFEMGFKEQLNEILNKLPDTRQTLLFSATLPQSLVEFARAGLQNPTLIRLDTESRLSEKLKLAFFQTRIEDKLPFLIYLLNSVIKAVKKPSEMKYDDPSSGKKLEQTIVFVATKHHVEFLRELLDNLGYDVSYAYSSLDQAARQLNIAKFQNRKSSLMIVTDVAARGIDIPMLDNVINFNFPGKAKLFVHRVGRVARAGNYGNSFSFVANDELPYMYELFEFLGKPIRFANDDMNPEDWNEVYGSVPQEILSIQRDEIKSLIDSKVELQGAFQVQENAYKHYLKSRPLPDSYSVRAAKNIRATYHSLPIHPILKSTKELKSELDSQSNLLNRLKNYVTKTTIFEINKATSNKSGEIMRKKRAMHDKIVDKYKNIDFINEKYSVVSNSGYAVKRDMFQKNDQEDDRDEEEVMNGDKVMYDDQDLEIKIVDNNDDGDSRKKRKSISKVEKRKMAKPVIDQEHYIPYKPKNFNSEKALGINTNFNREISDATMDLVADDATEIHKSLQKKKWDRKKKKFVSVQSLMDKSKKIKTESGSYIKASYKKDLYSKWLKNHKTLDKDDNNNDDQDDENDQHKRSRDKKYFGSSLMERKYFGSGKFRGKGKRPTPSDKNESSFNKKRKMNGEGFGKHDKNEKTGDSNGRKKRFSVGLKSKDQILKERARKSKIKKFQNSRKKPSTKRWKKRST